MHPPSDPLLDVLRGCAEPLIAVSGGVDSLTLASFAHRAVGGVRMAHAVSPAVPRAATARVRRFAEVQGWDLAVVEAGEFSDGRYLANPVNRCFYCKTNLYDRLGGLGAGTVLSGANLDDLGDYRPGLAAAADHGVRHPFIEAGMDKAAVRALARALGLGDVADLPASPCLSSRMETGLAITADALALVERVETWLAEERGAKVARCRVRPDGLEIELGAEEHAREHARAGRDGALVEELRRAHPALRGVNIRIGAYRRGSAFVGDKSVVRP
ncbi:hypothetical protein [Azospirillum sp.]|uniref:hypothetical protein n=1 Tax=Azospirillum sp. TaxID=34012 RepID=UPI002D6BBAF9|nr:hypothetical protein [Azospirillum sp.]HYD68815.1 hypothetical protein [Azospirillum sp.]